MRQILYILSAFLLLATPAWAGQNILTWQDNSTNDPARPAR